MRPLLRLVLLLATLSATFLSGLTSAQAQTVSLQDRNFRVVRSEENERDSDQRPQDVSRQDCLDDSDPDDRVDITDRTMGTSTWISIQPGLSGLNTGQNPNTLEIWVSQTADCSNQDERVNGSNCHIVAREEVRGTTADIQISPRVVVERAHRSVPSGGFPHPEESVCDLQVDQPIIYHLLLFDGDDVVSNAKYERGRLDTQAPDPPDSFSANPGDTYAFLEWDIDSENEANDADGFVYYCVPAGTTSDSDPMGLGGAGGAQVALPTKVPAANKRFLSAGSSRPMAPKRSSAERIVAAPLAKGRPTPSPTAPTTQLPSLLATRPATRGSPRISRA